MQGTTVPLLDISLEDLRNFCKEVNENLGGGASIKVTKIEGNLAAEQAKDLKSQFPDANISVKAEKLKEGRINAEVLFPAVISIQELADMKKISLLSTLFASGCHMGLRK